MRTPARPDSSAATAPARRKPWRRWRRIADVTAMSIGTLLFAAPILYLLLGSLKPNDKVLAGLSGFVPSDLSLDN